MIKIKKYNIAMFMLVFFCLTPFLTPASYCLGSILSNFMNLWLRFTWIIALLLILFRRKISKFNFIIIAFQFCFLLATILNKEYGSVKDAIYLFCNNCSIILISDYLLKKDTDCFLKYTTWIFGFLIIINIITMFIYYPNGMYIDILGDRNYYFLEHDNGSFFYTLPVLFLSIIYSLKKHNKISIYCYLFLIINILGYVYVMSTIASVCLVALMFCLLYINSKTLNNIINSKAIGIILISILVGLLFFNLQSYFVTNILNYFNKDVTLSGRTIIWQRAFDFIKVRPIIGYGQELLQIRLLRFGISHVHNILLQIIYNGGFLAFFIYILCILMLNKSINNCENSKMKFVMKVIMYLYFFASIFDFYNTKFIVYIIFVCCGNSNLLNNKVGDPNE